MWGHMSHPNIVPLHGVATALPQLVSEWMENGAITEYIMKHPDADRLGLVCFPPLTRGEVLTSPPNQLLDTAKGLNYLHSIHVVHGDLKGVR